MSGKTQRLAHAVLLTCMHAAAAGVEIATGTTAWTLTTEEEPTTVIILLEAGEPAVSTALARAGQAAPLKAGTVYSLQFQPPPGKG